MMASRILSPGSIACRSFCSRLLRMSNKKIQNEQTSFRTDKYVEQKAELTEAVLSIDAAVLLNV
jgi:hypothetical protein